MSQNKLLPHTLDMLILRCLTTGRMHGYTISRLIRQRSKEALTVEEGSLYPALHRLESRGWITAEWGFSENNRRAKYYSIGKQGRAQLAEKKREWNRLSDAVSHVMNPWPKGAVE